MNTPTEFPPVLGEMIEDPTPGCFSRFLDGYAPDKALLISYLFQEWLYKCQNMETKFVILVATPIRAAELRKDLKGLRESMLHTEICESNRNLLLDLLLEPPDSHVQPATEFLHNDSIFKRHIRYVVVVDTLFPDLFAWDFAVYISLQIWVSRADKTPIWVRMFFLQPRPSSWDSECFLDVGLAEHISIPERHEEIIPNCSDPNEKVAEAVVSKLQAILGSITFPKVVIVGPRSRYLACHRLLSKQKENCPWLFYELPNFGQRRYIEERQRHRPGPFIFYSATGIGTITGTIDRLAAIISVGPQQKQVFTPGFQGTPTTVCAMTTSEIKYSCDLLMRPAIANYTPVLYQIRGMEEPSGPKNHLHFHPLVAIFLITGITGLNKLGALSTAIESCLPINVERYVNHLIKRSFLETRAWASHTQLADSSEKYVVLHGPQAKETFHLMVTTGRTDLEFCWLEVGIRPDKDLSRPTIDVACGFNRLVSLLRPHPGRPKISVLVPDVSDDIDINEIIAQRINVLLPTYLHSWMDKGAPWLSLLLSELMRRRCLMPPEGDTSALAQHGWFELAPGIGAECDFIQSLVVDGLRLDNQSCLSGYLFQLTNGLDSEKHVNNCYEEIMRQLLDAFSDRLVLITYFNSNYLGFEYSSAMGHEISDDPLTILLLRRKPDIVDHGTAIFGLYFNITVSDQSSTISDILIVPDKVVHAWARRTKYDFTPSRAL
ncbi:hypothetical protein O1611_g446 [Lasiodiplodia mahajangana]|uniref:Uncharacterized protein n=1 Tax=Lasiodiplodia mahajangana TaxID=1108764 RepID=A0ACC2K086_9PEZI|nr:hypothetical protein O1611_g446 [Lasiodiplodia mahajangana]